jgi:hypothetical protein
MPRERQSRIDSGQLLEVPAIARFLEVSAAYLFGGIGQEVASRGAVRCPIPPLDPSVGMQNPAQGTNGGCS